ncbi:MAG: InlB B-repeat-containing protein [Slackia sp.]
MYNWNVVTPADKPGYEFVGWCVEGTDYTVDPATTVGPQHNTTFVAKWNKVETPVQEPVTYTFVDEDWTVLGSVTYAYEQVLEGVFNWDVVEPVKEGYEFVGWCVAGTDYVIDPAFVAGPQHDQTFVAKWNKVETPVHEDVTYTFVEEDWTVLGSSPHPSGSRWRFQLDVVKLRKAITSSVVLRGTDRDDPATVAGPQRNATFVAKGRRSAMSSRMTFTFYDEDQTTVLGDVTYTMSQIEAGVYNWNVITPAPRDGYVFEGWSYMGSDAIIDFEVTRAPNTDQSLVAHWKAVDPETVTHKVTFSDGIDATEDAVIEVEDGKAVARPGDPELAGYKFLGWTLDKETMELYDFDTPVTADITLHGVWQKVAAVTPGADENQAQGENGKTEGSETESAKADKAELTTLPRLPTTA